MDAVQPVQVEQEREQVPIWTRDFVLLLLGSLLQGISFYFLLPALPLYVSGPLAAGEQAIGLVVGIFSLTAVMIRPMAGYLLDRFGRRQLQLGATGLFCLTLFAYLLARNLQALLAVRLLHGLTWGLASVAAATVAADIVPASRRGTGLSLFGLSVPLAMSIGPMLGAAVLHGSDFPRLFAASGLISALAWTCFWQVRHPRVALQSSPTRLTVGSIVEVRVLPLSAFMLILCVGYGALVAFLPLHGRAVGFATPGPLFLAYAIGALLTRLFAGSWYDRRGPQQPTSTGLALLLTGWLCLGFLASRGGLLAGCLALGLGFGIVAPNVQAMAMELVPSLRRGAANATLFSSNDIGIMCGSIGFGLLAPSTGLATIYTLAALGVLAASLLFLCWVHPCFARHRAALRLEETGVVAGVGEQPS